MMLVHLLKTGKNEQKPLENRTLFVSYTDNPTQIRVKLCKFAIVILVLSVENGYAAETL